MFRVIKVQFFTNFYEKKTSSSVYTKSNSLKPEASKTCSIKYLLFKSIILGSNFIKVFLEVDIFKM